MPPRVRVVLFGPARAAVRRSALEWPCPRSGLSVPALVRGLSKTYPTLAPILRTSRFVRNGSYLRGTSGRLRPGDEIAVHPPFSGG